MNLRTNYLGLELRSPLVASASPISKEIDNIKKLEDAGAGAVVLFSLFEEQLIGDQRELHYHTTSHNEISPEAASYFPDPGDYKMGPEAYLEHISKAKAATGIPIIASLNCCSPGNWTSYGKLMQEAGADAIELNIYNIPTNPKTISEEIETNYIEILKAVKTAVKIPVAVKVSPYFSNMTNMAKRLDDAGADALVLFNRFYQPDINLGDLEIEPKVELSGVTNYRLPLRWIAILKDRIKADLAATSGIQTGEDVLKMLLVGANVTMLCGVMLRNGIEVIKTIEKQMASWMNAKEYSSIQQLQGSMSQSKLGDPKLFERAQYMRAITNYKF